MNKTKIAVAVLALILVTAFFVFDLGQYLSLNYLKQKHQTILDFYAANRILTIVVFFIIYVLVAALSLPGAALLTLAAGAIFGLLTGLVIVSFASTLGATLAFLISRFMFRDTVQKKLGNQLATINRGVEEEGAFYLFTLRLIPAVPFFVVNLLMGLTPIKTGLYAIISQLGMLPGTAVFINAGSQLSKISSLSDILSPSLLFAFALLGIFPIVAKKLLTIYKNRAASR